MAVYNLVVNAIVILILNTENITLGREGTVLWKVLCSLDSVAPGPGQH